MASAPCAGRCRHAREAESLDHVAVVLFEVPEGPGHSAPRVPPDRAEQDLEGGRFQPFDFVGARADGPCLRHSLERLEHVDDVPGVFADGARPEIHRASLQPTGKPAGDGPRRDYDPITKVNGTWRTVASDVAQLVGAVSLLRPL